MSAPSPLGQSSGDLLVDRRFAYAEALMAEGDHVAAMDLLGQILAAAPHWVPAWMALGEAAEDTGDLATALQAYDRAEALDPCGAQAAGVHAARLRGDRVGPALPARYIAALFDDYAPRFERHLVDGLGYTGPAAVMAALQAAGAMGPFDRVLDLGCGTGLMGRALRGAARRLEGVDLSPRMIAEARRAGIYDGLQVGGLDEALAAADERYDLVVAADVLVYCGPLDAILRACSRALTPGGLLAFTVQAGDVPFRLGDDMRFAHSADYVREALAASGLDRLVMDPVSARREAGHAVPGLVVVARRP